MSGRNRLNFNALTSFGVELTGNEAVAATTVEMANGFTAVHAAPPTITRQDIFGGRYLFTHTAAANQYMALYSNAEMFQFVQGQPIWFHARLLLGPTTPEEENLFIGCMDALQTAAVVDAGAGPKATGDHFGFYTPEAGGVTFDAADDDMWIAVSQHNGTEIRTVLNAANSIDRQDHRAYVAGPGAGIETDFEADFVPTGPIGGTGGVTIFDADIEFTINGLTVAVHHHSAGAGGGIAITVANTTLMHFGIAMQNTAAATTALLSRMGCHQLYDGRE